MLRTPSRNRAWQVGTFFFEEFVTVESTGIQNLALELLRIDEHLGDASAMGRVVTNITRSIDVAMVVWNSMIMCDNFTPGTGLRVYDYLHEMWAVDRLDQSGNPTGLTTYNPWTNHTPITTLLATSPDDENTPTRILWSSAMGFPVGADNATPPEAWLPTARQRQGRHRLALKLRIDEEHGLYYNYSGYNPALVSSIQFFVALQGHLYYRVRIGGR